MIAAMAVLTASFLAGGIAIVHGWLTPLNSQASSAARLLEVSACESAARAIAATSAIPAIDECFASSPQTGARKEPQPGSALHTITVKFDYDFTRNPVCKGELKDACVSTFIVYDISGTKPYKLFSIPAPADAKGLTKGITATSPRMLFGVGRHRIGVAAASANGKESPPIDCNTIVEIKPVDAGSVPPAP